MFKINIEGSRAKQLRLIHSKKLRGFRFIKTRNTFSDNDDLSGEKDIITDYLVEKNEIDYTHYEIFLGLAISFILSIVVITLNGMLLPVLSSVFAVVGVIFFVLSRWKKQSFILGEIGIELTENFYNHAIKIKFNL